MQSKKIILFLTVTLLVLVLVTKNAEAKGKTKWQRNLEKRGVTRYLWSKYLPDIKYKEYKKALQKYQSGHRLHRNITTTYFWAGEDPGPDNGWISNYSSCWDDNWLQNSANENPYYFALPYNDFENGKRKSRSSKIIPWADEKNWGDLESMCKNRWIKITHKGEVVYAQWEDAGPMGENDANYVFGRARPKNKTNNGAGLDVSPAVKDYLGLADVDKTDWQFIDEKNVPEGPWKEIVTESGVSWN